MQFKTTYLHCGAQLQKTFRIKINEIFDIISTVHWKPEFTFQLSPNSAVKKHQQRYNEAINAGFRALGWQAQPKISESPRLIGDFGKDLVFVEVQFGNSATLYRDFYKFQYGVQNGLVSLNVLVTPTTPREFFPTRPSSVFNMAEYDLALRYFSVLPISVPVLVIGLLPEN